MANGYDFYLDKCLLPVTPDKLEVKIKQHACTALILKTLGENQGFSLCKQFILMV